MDVEYPGFGTIVIEGDLFDRDMIVERGEIRPRKKGPSKSRRDEYGHTPLTAAEDLPWSSRKLVIGTGYSGSLPIADDVWAEARARNVEVVALPTSEACALLRSMGDEAVAAVLHVTC
jgi:hypothetical protein